MPLCRACHDGAHVLLRGWHIDRSKLPLRVLLVARLAALFAWLAMADRPVTFDSEVLGYIASVLNEVMRLVRSGHLDSGMSGDDDARLRLDPSARPPRTGDAEGWTARILSDGAHPRAGQTARVFPPHRGRRPGSVYGGLLPGDLG